MIKLYPRNRLGTAEKKQIRNDYQIAKAALEWEKELAERAEDDDTVHWHEELQQSPRGKSGQTQEEIDREIAAAVFEREVYEKRRRDKELDLSL